MALHSALFTNHFLFFFFFVVLIFILLTVFYAYSLCLLSVCAKLSSVVSDSLRPLATVVRQAPLSMGFPRQEYWGALPFPPLGDLPNPKIEDLVKIKVAVRMVLTF